MSAPAHTSDPLIPPSPLKWGQAFSTAFKIVGKRFGLFLGLALLPVLAVLLIVLAAALLIGIGAGIVFAGGGDPSPGTVIALLVGFFVVMLLVMAFTFAVTFKVNGMTVALAAETAVGARPSFGDLNRITRGIVRRAIPLIALFAAVVVGWYLLFIVVVLVSAGADFTAAAASDPSGLMGVTAALFVVVSVVLAAWLGTRFLYYQQVLAIEDGAGLQPLRRSWALTAGNFWRTLVWSLALALIVTVLYVAVMAVVTALSGVPFDQAVGASEVAPTGPAAPLSSLVSSLLGLLVTPLSMSFYTVMYLDQRRRKGEQVEADPTGGGHTPYGNTPYGDAPWGGNTNLT